MRITLTVTAGPHQGREFTFAGHDLFLVGRSKRAHFQLPLKDRYFSRMHFLIEVNPPCCQLMDMGSRNGTYLNGARVETGDLKNGDEIRAGQTVLNVAIESVPVLTSSGPSSDSEGKAAAELALPSPENSPPREEPPAPHCANFHPGTVSFVPIPPLPLPVPLPPLFRRRPASPTETCLVCEAALTRAGRAEAQERSSPGLPPLCSACQEQIRQHPQPISAYQIVREIGRGGMGVVYLALRKADGNPVALKTITPATGGTQPEIDRFLREARILSQLDHPHIIAFRDMGHANGRLYFAMDYVRGTDAAQLLKKHGGPLPIGRAVGLVCQLLDALAYAHARGFVHRDLKPANLLVTKSEGRELAKLVDFGLARVYQASRLSGLTLKGELGGTPAFLAPEQITKFREAKPPADQYAAGATLYNLLTNQFIYDLPPRVPEQIAAILQKKPVPIQKRRPDIPKELADIVHRSLAREPKARFPDVGVMRKALLVGG